MKFSVKELVATCASLLVERTDIFFPVVFFLNVIFFVGALTRFITLERSPPFNEECSTPSSGAMVVM